jgi:hypothetical protein
MPHLAGRVVVGGADAVDEGLGLDGGHEPLRAAGHQLEQQVNGAGSRSGSACGPIRAPVDQPRNATSSSSGWTTVRFEVRRATMATEWASAGSVLRPLPVSKTRTRAAKLGRYVDYQLAVGDQVLGHVLAGAVAALHRPPAGREPSGYSISSPGGVQGGHVVGLVRLLDAASDAAPARQLDAGLQRPLPNRGVAISVSTTTPRNHRPGPLATHPPSRLHVRIEPDSQVGGVLGAKIDLEGDSIQTERDRLRRLGAVQIINQLLDH